MYTHLLEAFAQPVPFCAISASLDVVLDLFRQYACERLLLLDEQHIPVGVITVHKVVPYLSSGHLATPLDVSVIEQHSSPRFTQGTALSRLQLVEPLTTLAAHCRLDQLQPYLQSLSQGHWAIVTESGTCLGLLDQLRLWQFLALNPTAIATSSDHNDHRDTHRDTNAVTTRSPNPKANLFADAIFPLTQLLDRLPLPLMLQTATGRVLSQNRAWQQQLGELQDPYSIRREAAIYLEAIARESSRNGSERSRANKPANRQSIYTSDWLSSGRSSVEQSAELEQPAGVCHLGTDANTCICVCPMKNGQERVWQFVKIPLGTALAEPDVSPSTPPSQTDSSGQTLSSRFHLAALESSIDQSRQLDPGTSTVPPTETLWLVLAQDTTEHQQVAKELAAKNADLVQLNRLKDEFLACISHELKTPLTAILGLSSLLKEQALGPLNDRQSRYAHLIHQGGRHLILVVNDILDLTRIETGQLDLMPEPVNIAAVCQRAFEQARQLRPITDGSQPNAEANSHPETFFELDIQPGLVSIVADELRLRQMLTNLLSNALKFTEVGGDIGLEVSIWEGWIAFTVWDTGIGIPSDKQHLIFQKFQQLERPLTRRFEGTGLGLVLTQRLARLHGGDVTFTSVEGQGSRFTLLLPPSPPQVKKIGMQRETVRTPAPASNNRLVLVVEAVPRFLEGLTSQLSGLGYRVAIARSGTEALEKARRLQPAVVFLNPLLPLLSGWDVLTLLKSDEETHQIPVIITATQVEKNQAYSNGADHFLSLPVQTEALKRSLDYLADRAPVTPLEGARLALTVLHLHITPTSSLLTPHISDAESQGMDLNSLLHPHHCRVLQVDDLDQADLLGRVWKPDLVLLDGAIADPLSYLQQFNQYPFLTSLPLVTLTPEMTQAANQVAGLVVFPCLAPLVSVADSGAVISDASALWQVMQIAAGTNWTAHVLAVDFAALEAAPDFLVSASRADSTMSSHHETEPNKAAEWLQALVQYIQSAGFRCSVGRSYKEVLYQVEHQSIDLLLLCVRSLESHPATIQALQTLAQIDPKPPILVWSCQTSSGSADSDVFTNVLGAIATQILPPTLSMQELLDQINQTLVEQ